MLPREIDLTENRQFSGGNDFSNITTIPRGFFNRYDGENITTEDLDFLLWWEGIFGVENHPNAKSDVFRKDDDIAFFERSMMKCPRCGKDNRVPWNRFHGLCKECAEATDIFQDTRRPWEPALTFSERDSTMDVFDLR